LSDPKILVVSLRKPREWLEKTCRTAGLMARKSADGKPNLPKKQKEVKKRGDAI